MTKFVIRKNENETWRECVERIAKRHSLEKEVLAKYDEEIANGTDEAQAAFDACYEWDIIDMIL